MRMLLIAGAAALLAGCMHHGHHDMSGHHGAPGHHAGAEHGAAQLTGATWRRVDDQNANPHGGTITFEDGRASGHSGCNRWFASVTRTGDRLSFGDAGLTRMACAEPQMAAEQSFVAALSATRRYRFDGDDLVFTDDAGAVTARFVRER